MTDFESAKAEFLAAVEHFLWERRNGSRRGLLGDWVGLLSRTGFSSLDFSFSPRELHDHYSSDEVVFSSTFDFHDPDYLRECCSPGSDCLAGKRCIPIGGVDGADGFIYLSEDVELRIAHLHHDDVFSASDLDAVVAEEASRLKVSLQAFVGFLRPQTKLAKLSASLDASKWLVVENVGTLVRYEIHLSEDWDVGERSFHGLPESEEFFFELIRGGCATMELSLLHCSPHIRQRIEAILSS
jgi:hypothetical protein